MRTTTIDVNVYDVGDVISLDKSFTSLMSKQRTIGDSKRGIVINASQRADKLFTYRVLCSNGCEITIRPDEQGRETYIGHVDLDMLFECDNHE